MSASAAAAQEPHHEEETGGLEAVPDPDEQLVIEAGGQISLKVGGRNADEATLTLQGGEVKVSGQFEKGERARLEIEGVVSEITFTDLMDRKTGNVTGTKRKHVLKIDGIQVVEE